MSKVEDVSVTAVEIKPDVTNLDPIQVFWADYGLGRGSVTITCYGCAWTAYFGAMSERTIREFFLRADVGYLATKLGINPTLKQGKRHEAYLVRIITEIQAALSQERRAA